MQVQSPSHFVLHRLRSVRLHFSESVCPNWSTKKVGLGFLVPCLKAALQLQRLHKPPSVQNVGGSGSVLLHHSAYSVSGQNRLRGGAQVPDAAVLRLALQPQGGAVPGEAVQPVGAAVSGLGVEARQAAKGGPVVWCPEAGARVPAVRRRVSFSGGSLRGVRSAAATHLPSRERCRLPW